MPMQGNATKEFMIGGITKTLDTGGSPLDGESRIERLYRHAKELTNYYFRDHSPNAVVISKITKEELYSIFSQYGNIEKISFSVSGEIATVLYKEEISLHKILAEQKNKMTDTGYNLEVSPMYPRGSIKDFDLGEHPREKIDPLSSN